MGYATWIKDRYEKLIQDSCRSQESCQEESEPGQAKNDRHVPLHEPRLVEYRSVKCCILFYNIYDLLSWRKDIVQHF